MPSLEIEWERTLFETGQESTIYYYPVDDDSPFFLSQPFTVLSGTR